MTPWLAFWLGLFIAGCTENPFFKDDSISQPHRTIAGSVRLSDGLSPDGVFIWLEGHDLTATTDTHGRFSLTLPPPVTQAGDAYPDGVFRVFYFLANYYLETARVKIRKGEFLRAQADVTAKGELAPDKILQKFLRIEVTVGPNEIKAIFRIWSKLRCDYKPQNLRIP
ncbi:MAG: hypothetical protein Q9P90_13595 [candidate division KSB1 bacterium]|nr:hypothetical protein [candidate division KSB1 bacterium]